MLPYVEDGLHVNQRRVRQSGCSQKSPIHVCTSQFFAPAVSNTP